MTNLLHIDNNIKDTKEVSLIISIIYDFGILKNSKLKICCSSHILNILKPILLDNKIDFDYIDNPRNFKFINAFFYTGTDEDKFNFESLNISVDNLFFIDKDLIIKSLKNKITDFYFPSHNTHIFNEIGTKEDQSFSFFPYGYQYRFLGGGKTNELGFRIECDLSKLANRKKNHKIIAMFGGSGMYSVRSKSNECFSKILQTKINDLDLTNSYTILNFGLPGGVILNEILNYILYAQVLKPEITISHSGFNDFRFGAINDPFLLKKYNISYLSNLEGWSQHLHNNFDKELNYFKSDVPIINSPSTIIKAYINRILQFRDIVEGTKGTFITALQPLVWSKKKFSTFESKDILEGQKPSIKRLWKTNLKVPYIYERFVKKMLDFADINFLNIHKEFTLFDENKTLFRDFAHTNYQGDNEISKIYLKYLIDNSLIE